MDTKPESMDCPHCGRAFSGIAAHGLIERPDSTISTGAREFAYKHCVCPSCGKSTILIGRSIVSMPTPPKISLSEFTSVFMAWPRTSGRRAPHEVTDASMRADFEEASQILESSPRASAALGRSLAHVLETAAHAEGSELGLQIRSVLDAGSLPPQIADNLQAVLKVADLAAHPIKNSHPGCIDDEQAGEAEWLLDVLEDLFDYYFVAPAKAGAKRRAMEARLAATQIPSKK